MRFPEIFPRNRAVAASFIPWPKMTRRQQAEHLVLAHGMGVDYHGDLTELGLPGDATDADLVAWHESLSPELLAHIHSSDEAYFDAEGETTAFAATHTHNKEVPPSVSVRAS